MAISYLSRIFKRLGTYSAPFIKNLDVIKI